MPRQSRNIAVIDGQNLHLGVKDSGWSIDYRKFRIYLRDKYKIDQAYYFLGFHSAVFKNLYESLRSAGFIVSFREHTSSLIGGKKGNVDTDIVFFCMRTLVEHELFGKIFIVSGDGDYKKLIEYLIEKGKFGKILFPSKAFASSLYKNLGNEYSAYLVDARDKIAFLRK